MARKEKSILCIHLMPLYFSFPDINLTSILLPRRKAIMWLGSYKDH